MKSYLVSSWRCLGKSLEEDTNTKNERKSPENRKKWKQSTEEPDIIRCSLIMTNNKLSVQWYRLNMEVITRISDAAQVMMINSTVVKDSDYETKLRDLRIHSDDFPTRTKTLNVS